MEFRFKYTMWECVYYVVRDTFRLLLKLRLLQVILGIGVLTKAMLAASTLVLIQLLRGGLRKERFVCMRDGVILAETAGDGEPGVIPCKNIESDKVSGPLIWMRLPYSGKSVYIRGRRTGLYPFLQGSWLGAGIHEKDRHTVVTGREERYGIKNERGRYPSPLILRSPESPDSQNQYAQ